MKGPGAFEDTGNANFTTSPHCCTTKLSNFGPLFFASTTCGPFPTMTKNHPASTNLGKPPMPTVKLTQHRPHVEDVKSKATNTGRPAKPTHKSKNISARDQDHAAPRSNQPPAPSQANSKTRNCGARHQARAADTNSRKSQRPHAEEVKG